jgi:hypothetical protein
VGPVIKQVEKSNDPHGGQGLAWVRDMARIGLKHRIPLHFLNIVILHLPAYEDGTDSVPKRRHIKFRRQEITQKKAYNSRVYF